MELAGGLMLVAMAATVQLLPVLILHHVSCDKLLDQVAAQG